MGRGSTGGLVYGAVNDVLHERETDLILSDVNRIECERRETPVDLLVYPLYD